MPPAARVSGQRRYRPTAADTVGIILLLREIGFSLSEIKVFMTSRSHSPGAWRELARQKLAEVDERIFRARVAQVALQHTLGCRHDNLFDCPNFAGAVAAKLAGKSLEEAHSH